MAQRFLLLEILRALKRAPRRPKELVAMFDGVMTEATLHQYLDLLTKEGWIHSERKSYKNVLYVLDLEIPDASIDYPTFPLRDEAIELRRELEKLWELYKSHEADLTYVVRRAFWQFIRFYHSHTVTVPAEFFATAETFYGKPSKYLQKASPSLFKLHTTSPVFIQLFFEAERERTIRLHEQFFHFLLGLNSVAQIRLQEERNRADSLLEKLGTEGIREYRRRWAELQGAKKSFKARIKRLEAQEVAEVTGEDRAAISGYARRFYDFMLLDTQARIKTFSVWDALLD